MFSVARHKKAATLALFTLVLATVLGGLGPCRAPRAQAADWDVKPLKYDVSATYIPGTQTLQVAISMEFEALHDMTGFGLWLRSYFSPPAIENGPGLASFEARDVSQEWREYRSVGPHHRGDTIKTIWTYEGTPSIYDRSQDRYWTGARADSIWLTDTGHWLPCPNQWYWAGQGSFALHVTVPDGWCVFAPSGSASPYFRQGPAVGAPRTFDFEAPFGSATPCWWVAGPYTLEAQGEIAGVPYSVWSLPAWKSQGERLAAETPKMMDFLAGVLGKLPDIDMRIIQVHPDQGGGVSSAEGLTAVSPKGTDSKFGLATNEALWTHEFAHSLAYFGDEGWAEFLAAYYMAKTYPNLYPVELEAERGYFLRSVAEHGDFGIKDATERRFSRDDIPEWHAYVYVKPALVWSMYRGVFGDDATRLLLARLQADLPKSDSVASANWSSSALWDRVFALYTDLAVEAAEKTGSSAAAARAFCDRWFNQVVPLDLGLEEVSATRPPGDQGDWTVSFAVRDVREDLAPKAKDSIPWVQVSTSVEGGEPVLTRVELMGDVSRATVTVPGRPIKVTLDPGKWLLDYDRANNAVEVPIPPTMAEILRVAIPLAALAAAGMVGVWLARRRPAGLKAPPSAGQAR